MKRSPLLAAFLVALAATFAWSQVNSPQLQPASSAAKVPLAGVEANGQQTNGPGSQAAVNAPSVSAGGTASSLQGVLDEPIVPVPASNENLAQPPQPKTEILDNSGPVGGLSTDGHDPILDPPPLPTGLTTLVGGVVRSIDHIRNTMTIAVFAGKRWKIALDERTHVFLNGAETTQLAIQKGERVYVDTMLDNKRHDVFARNIRIGTPVLSADADGQVVDLDQERGTVTLLDRMNSTPARFRVDAHTRIVYGNNPVSIHELRKGSLVHVRFVPEQSNRGLAREIVVIAAPGSVFTYVGKITYLDIRRGMLALTDKLDQKSYEIHFDPARAQSRSDLAVGSEVRIEAIFEGNRYNGQSIVLTKSAQAAERDSK